MAEIKKLLDDAIETEINNLNSASDKDEKSEVIKKLAALHKLRIEELKTETEIEEKSERRAMDKAVHDEDATLKAFQLDENKLDRYAKIGIAAAELVLPLMFYGVWMSRGLRFEETGTFTSQTFKNLFNRFKPTFTPTSNYKWSDGSTGGKTASWTIGKAANSVTNSPSSIVLKSSAKTATFTVNRKGNGTITATSNNTSVAKIKSINQSTGVVTVESVNDMTGTAKITVKVAEGTNHKAASDTTVNVTATFVTIYGVEWDWTSGGSTKGTRTDAAASFGDPSPAVNNGSGSSPFDNLMPWSGMVKETRAGGVEVKEPKYWFKWTKTGKKLKLQIADGYVEGFSVDPVNRDRGDGLGELDYSYIGRYHCASGYKSTTGAAQQVNITRSQARSGIHNLGANFWQMDFAQFWYVNMLFLVEFADWNGERIGRGCSTNGSKMNNGQTDAMGYHTGTTAASRDSYGFTQYRNIEGWWDNVYDWMDGCYFEQLHPKTGELSDDELDNVAGGGCHTKGGYLLTTAGYRCGFFEEDTSPTAFGLMGTCCRCRHWDQANWTGYETLGAPLKCLNPKNRRGK